MDKPLEVLFLGATNGARSIIAEFILARRGGDRFRAHSAGRFPVAQLDGRIIAFLTARGYATDALHPKPWDAFAGSGAPRLDVVITLADSLVGDVCAVHWTGRPTTAHWPLPEPSGPQDFATLHAQLETRIDRLIALPIEELDTMALQARLDAIGRL